MERVGGHIGTFAFLEILVKDVIIEVRGGAKGQEVRSRERIGGGVEKH